MVKSIDDLVRLYGREIKGFDQSPEFLFFRDLDMKPHEVQWHSVLTKEKYGTILKSVIDGARSSLEFSRTDPYLNTFLKSRASLGLLQRAHVNRDLLLRRIAVAEGTQKSNLQTFLPLKDGFARPINYNQFGTVTGRLTVESGPQILTLARTNRDIIDSRWGKDGTIMYVDFVSLEPRVALMRLGLDPGNDVYEYVNDRCFGGELTRAKAKISTLGALYGMSVRTFGSHSAAGKRSMDEVKKLFQIKTLSAELEEEMEDLGKIMNMFGRQIVPNDTARHILVNAWLQSTAVDVAMTGFYNLVESLGPAIRANPLFYIHDACIFDVHNEDLEQFEAIISKGTVVTGLGNFPITCNRLADEI